MNEDRQLMTLVSVYGNHNWVDIASHFDNRTPKQCRERWVSHVDPTINKGPWTYDEDALIVIKHQELGNKWAEIARCLPGRTDTLVKNRWNTSIKQRLDQFQSYLIPNYIISNGAEKAETIRTDILPILLSPVVLDFSYLPPLIIQK